MVNGICIVLCLQVAYPLSHRFVTQISLYPVSSIFAFKLCVCIFVVVVNLLYIDSPKLAHYIHIFACERIDIDK